MSTILETSFAILSGKLGGKSLPTSFRLQRYMASANSGKSSWPDFVVSDNTLDDLSEDKRTCLYDRPTICA